MAEVLTVGERQLVADHLRAGGRIAAFWAACHVAAFGIGTAAGLVICHTAHALQRLHARD